MESRVEVTSHATEYERALHQAIERALEQAGVIALQAVKATPTTYNIAAIMDAVYATGVERTTRGLGVWLIAGDWRGIFFEGGTYTRHKGKLKQARRSNRANRGVKAIHFLRHGIAAGKAALPDLLKTECERIRI